jgi:hypothetical protein
MSTNCFCSSKGEAWIFKLEIHRPNTKNDLKNVMVFP